MSCRPTRTGRHGETVLSWDQQVRCGDRLLLSGRTGWLWARTHPRLQDNGVQGGPSGRRCSISIPLPESEGRGLCGPRGLRRVGWGREGRCLGARGPRRPAVSLGPCLIPSGRRDCSSAQPLGDLMVFQELDEVVHRSGLVPGGPAFGTGGAENACSGLSRAGPSTSHHSTSWMRWEIWLLTEPSVGPVVVALRLGWDAVPIMSEDGHRSRSAVCSNISRYTSMSSSGSILVPGWAAPPSGSCISAGRRSPRPSLRVGLLAALWSGLGLAKGSHYPHPPPLWQPPWSAAGILNKSLNRGCGATVYFM